MNRNHASKGYLVVAGTDTVAVNFFGFTALEETQIAAITGPTAAGPEQTSYSSDALGIEGTILTAGAYLPIRGSSIALSSGRVVAWIE